MKSIIYRIYVYKKSGSYRTMANGFTNTFLYVGEHVFSDCYTAIVQLLLL
jgi:hypothetical protein